MSEPSRRHPLHPALPPLAAALALAALALPSGAVASGPSERIAEPASAIRDYWTPQRMRAAEPLDALTAGDSAAMDSAETGPQIGGAPSYVPAATAGAPARAAIRSGPGRIAGLDSEPVADPSAADMRAHGKVFFTIPQGDEAGDYVCSGTAVNSRNRSVVWTAGHCVFDLNGGGYTTNWSFVPAYADEAAPYGEWPARRLATTKGWQATQNLHFDLGAAVVRRSDSGRRLQRVVGGRGIAFDQPRDHRYGAFGYPAELPFTGEREYRCDSGQTGTDQPPGSGPLPMSIRCDMTAGASGGGWIVGTTLLSVTSYGYLTDPDRL